MTSKASKSEALNKPLKSLKISSPNIAKANKYPIVDNWEEEADSSGSSALTETPSNPSTPMDQETPGPPPPTPISPTSRHGRPKSTDWTALGSSKTLPPTSNPIISATSSQLSASTTRGSSHVVEKRPEKSNVAAERLIAGALGVKAPKKSEENKAYEKAVRDQERKRREKVKEEEKRRVRESEEAKQAIWDD